MGGPILVELGRTNLGGIYHLILVEIILVELVLGELISIIGGTELMNELNFTTHSQIKSNQIKIMT